MHLVPLRAACDLLALSGATWEQIADLLDVHPMAAVAAVQRARSKLRWEADKELREAIKAHHAGRLRDEDMRKVVVQQIAD